MSDNITAGCIVSTDFVTSGSTIFSGYIDYIDRETAVRNEHISDYSIYTDYMDNPEKTTELFTANSNRLSNEEKQQLKALYEKAQENGSPMWQTVISFDNRWLEKHGIYNAEEGFLDVPLIHDYTRRAVNKMLTKEGLELATWSAAIHYNTDNFHVHIATVEPIPTRPLISVKTVQFSSEWISRNNIIQDENIDFGKKVAAHRNKNYGYRSICNRLKNALESEGYNTRYLGDYIAVNANGTINLSFNGDNSNLPFHSTLIDEHKEYKGKFKQSSIDSCKSTMVNQILENELNNKKLNEVLRNQLAAAIKGDVLLENRDIVNQFLKVYDNLPDKKGYWQYNNNEYIGKLRPDIDKITEMYLERYKSKEFYELKKIIDHNDSLYREAYGLNSETHYSRNKYKELYTRCGNAILSVMKNISFRELDEIRSNTYISAEVEEAAITGEHIDFDGIINSQPAKSKSQSKFWTDEFKEARQLIYAGTEERIKNPDSLYAYTLFKDAENLLTEEIEKGNSIAAYELGRCYKLGTFGNIDLDLSSKYYKTAFDGFIAELNSDNWLNNMIALDELGKSRKAYSQKEFENKFREITKDIENDEWMQNYLHYRVGRMLLDGDGTEKNIKEGISHLEQSTSAFAHYTLGNIYYYGNEETEQDYELAYQHFSDAGYPEDGEKPVPFAVYNMAEMLSKELVQDNRLNKDLLYSKALSLFIASDENENNDLIEYRIASMLLEGKGCEIDEERAEKYLLKSAVFGNTYAQTKLANLYIKSGNPDLAERAVFLLQRAADSNNDVAQYQLGRILTDETSKYFNPNKGIELLEESANQDNEYAEYVLGNAFLKGSIVETDYTLALKFLSSASDKGNQFAQYQLGKIYLSDEYGFQDLYKSIRCFEQSAEQGNQFSQYQLGMLYLKGDVINQNGELAIHYLEQAANQDNEFAQYALGTVYLKEEITDIDYNKAIAYFEQSAEQNNSFAQYQLGKLYFFGADGIEVNKELALDYLNKSAAQGNEYAKALLEWKPGTYANFFHQQSFSETMVSLSSDMKMLFDRLANEHDHMLNQMVYENLMRKEEKEDIKEQ